MYLYLYLDNEELAHETMEAEKSHNPMICHLQAGAPGKPGVSFLRLENHRAKEEEKIQLRSQAEGTNSPFLHLSVLFRPSLNWMRLTHLRSVISFSQFSHLNAPFFWKHPHRHTEKSCLSRSLGTLWPGQVDM